MLEGRGPGAVLLLVALAAPGALAGGDALSPRNANYDIDVRLDAEGKTLEGRTVLDWRNLQPVPTDELWFHLYWNAWRNDRSTWMLDNRIGERSDLREEEIKEDDWGWIDVESVSLLPDEGSDEPPRSLSRRYASPDDGNPDDRTVLVVSLPRAVEADETVRVELVWNAKVPRTFARTGFRGNFFFLAHWFPKLGVYEARGWNCHQFHSGTEFFSDYGVYDVRMTVPRGWVVGASGTRISREDGEGGTTTHRYRQADVHGFAWTTSPHYAVREKRFDEPGLPPVDMRLLIQPEHLGQVDRYFTAAGAALESYGRWYGPYPYGHVTIVDPAYGSGAGGMEYPTLFTGGTRRLNPPGGDAPEGVTVHEMGHQFWYGIVGNNEFEHAWLDEGLNTFSTIRTLEHTYDKHVLVRRYLNRLIPVRFSDIEVSRWARRSGRYREYATSDTPSKPSYLYHPRRGYSITYDKTALWLATLEKHLGWETLREILSTFFQRYRFKHPTPDDFFAVAQEVAGQDLDWFFDQVYRDSLAFDYAIESVASFPAAPTGWVEKDGELVFVETDEDDDDRNGDDEASDDSETLYRTEVVVRRLGGGRFPVDVLLAMEDGEEIRRPWDGRERWTKIVVVRASKLEYAEVDPWRVLMLDVARTNNSRLRRPDEKLPAIKWGSKWMIWFQDLLSAWSFFL